ncbi:bacillithiol biosynthesis cysteine-adding enzyme BshC [Desulforamulus putei]|uniref:bacillithiol biosynthesis cysteine-adding enzyme BshC n=1 Tax=Desulforamulus putei TaxID=74701 RepID=UPI002FDDCBBD
MRIQELNGFYSQPLAKAYLSDFSEVSRFFTYDPRQIDGFAVRLKHLSAKKKGQLKFLAETLKHDNLQLGCGDQTLHNIGLLEKGLGVAVVTGQQPGILTGPLYTVYKAMGAIKLARELAAKLNYPVVPVFWIGADDHDFAEINHIFVPTAEGPQKITLTEKPAGRFSLGHVSVPQEVPLFLQQLEKLTPPIGWQQEGLVLLRETARQSANLAQWFGRLMTFLFKDDGLILMNPVLPPLRRLSAGLFYRAVKTAPEVDHLLQRTCQEVAAAGFSPQVQSEEDKLHLFIYIKGQRTALYLKKGQFTDREGVNTWEKEQLAQLSLSNPELFSPDVVLRPVVQEELLPVLAYVAGPGEISYFALLKNIFRHFGQEMPIVYPRPNITLVEPLVEKLLTKYQVPLQLLPVGLEGFIDDYVKRTDEVGIEEIFNDFRSVLREKQTNLVKEVATIDPELKGLGKENLRRLLRVVNSFEDKVKQRHRKNNEVAIRQLNKVNAMLHPLGQWQERVYNIFPYLMKYGPDLLKEIYPAIGLFNWKQKILFFD